MIIKIYTLSSTRNPNEIRYVGKTTQKLKRRLSQHLSSAKKYSEDSVYSNYNYNWINHELRDGYKILINELESLSFKEHEDWKWFEQYWISQFKVWGFKLTNLTDGGDGNQNQVFTKEAIEKRAEKIRGKHRDKETRKKISKGLTGIKRSEYTKKKISNAIKALQGKSVEQYDKNGNFIKLWPSIVDAARHYNVCPSAISDACKKEVHVYLIKGYFWRFQNDTTPIDCSTPKTVVVLDKETNKFLYKFQTSKELGEKLGISAASISRCLHGQADSAKGYKIMRYSEYKNI